MTRVATASDPDGLRSVGKGDAGTREQRFGRAIDRRIDDFRIDELLHRFAVRPGFLDGL
jgi:hypothetical protein